MVNRIGCRALFSTHYHTLSEKYSNCEEVEICRMAYNFDKDKNQLIYLYKLQKGACSSSFGINVAKIAGINQSIVEKALKKSEEFAKNLNHIILSVEKAN